MPDAVTVRRAERRDEDALLRLWKSFMDEQSAMDERFRIAEDAEERWRNDLPGLLKHERRRLYVAEWQGRPAGFLMAQRWAPPPIYVLSSELYVEEIYVHPDARDAGVGSALLDAAAAWARELKAERLRFSALAANAHGRSFWENHNARPFSITYTIELESRANAEDENRKTKLGFL